MLTYYDGGSTKPEEVLCYVYDGIGSRSWQLLLFARSSITDAISTDWDGLTHWSLLQTMLMGSTLSISLNQVPNFLFYLFP
jgi:serine/threonine protein phosphatase PrpC